ncbi:MAG: acyl-CoA/acyl-ACP dehydrogenase [Desulfobacterales bacterium]|jgi:alkylation response protein AidB-like acyl-CoA dehydrogenase
MDFDLSREQRLLKRSAREFLKKECPPSLMRELKDDPRGYPAKMWDRMADLGWTGVMIPEKYGGTGGSFLDLCILQETMGEACCTGPFFSTIVLGAAAVGMAGTEAQKEFILPRIADGSIILALAVTEPGTWYGTENIHLAADWNRGDYILDGTKLFVSNAHLADYIICAARTEASGQPAEDLTLFLVDTKISGVDSRLMQTLAYDKQCEVIFDRVRVPRDNVLGEVNRAGVLLESLRQMAVLAKCAELVGCIQTAFDMTVAYAGQRKQFGRPIGSFQAVQHHCANMAVDVDGSRFLTYQAAWKISHGLAAGQAVAMAKAWTSAAARRVTSLAHQIHGAVSFTEECDVHLYYRRAKAGEVAWGDAAYHLEQVARHLGL